MTESERRYHEKKLARDVERAKESAHKSHRERVNVSSPSPTLTRARAHTISPAATAHSGGEGADANEKRLMPSVLPVAGGLSACLPAATVP